MFESALAEQMKIELQKKEYKLEDGSVVTNLEGICQRYIGQALDGDKGAVELIAALLSGKK